MRNMLFATAAVLGLATAGAVMADQAPINFPQTAATAGTQLAGGWYPGATRQTADAAQPQGNAARADARLAQGNHPEAETDHHGTQLAAGWHPQAETDQRSEA